jgi:hypothetical protein
MGIIYGFHSLDPVVLGRLLDTPTNKLVEQLKARGVPPEDVGGDSWDEIDENAALTILATTREWDVDKSMEDLRMIPGLAGELSPVGQLLREMEDFTASSLPPRFHPPEIGLIGIAMPPSIEAAAAAITPFTGAEGRARLSEARLPLWQRLLSSSLRKRIRGNPYVWGNWMRLAEAIQWANTRHEWLGLHMA